MKVLVLYASTEGQTRKIAKFVAEEIEKLGHVAVLTDAEDPSEITLGDIDSAILAAPVHQRRHPRKFEALLGGFKKKLEQKPTLLLSVSMSAAFPEGLEEAGEYVTEMTMRTDFTPDEIALVAGAVRTTQYDYFAMQVIRHVVLRGRDYDATEGEHEFTDWKALSSTISDFVKR